MRSIPESELFDPHTREESVRWLRKTLALPPKPIEADPALISPLTVGIEIEETWRQALPALGAQWPAERGSPRNVLSAEELTAFYTAYNVEDTVVQPVLSSIMPAIPSPSFDSYWEFSLYPSKDLNYTKMEADSLFEAGLLKDVHEYPLHMTVAGIQNDRDAFTFVSALEMSGATTKERLARAAIARAGAWAQKSIGGIRRRRPDELSGGDTIGYELRTLCVSSQEQLARTLGKAAELATLYTSSDWKEFQTDVEQRQRSAGLQLAPWPKPHDDVVMWERYSGQLIQ